MERLMSKTVYDYMDWPEIEAVVYGEETAPRDVMGPRLTPDGVLIQGCFPEASAAGRSPSARFTKAGLEVSSIILFTTSAPLMELSVEFQVQ